MRIVSPLAISAVLFAAGTHAAPALDSDHQLVYQSFGLESLTLGLTSKLSSAISSIFSRPSATTFEGDEEKTIWELISSSEEFSQLAHVLNYSSDATKDILKKKDNLTLFAPLNWHHHRDDDKEGFQDLSFGPASIQQWTGIEKQIADYERDYGLEANHHDGGDVDDDEEKKRRRELIRHLIDSTALYHLVRSDTVLDSKAIADNSSVATWLNTGKAHANNDGTDWRVRTGKSLLPIPAIYLNLYSRVVKPDVHTKNGVVHGIKYPLLLPPDVLQTLFFGQTTFSTTTSGLQKVHVDKYLAYRPYHHAQHGHHGHHDHHDGEHKENWFNGWHHESNDSSHQHFAGVAAETIFVPTNLAWSRLPWAFRAYLFSPWGYHLLQKVFMLHSLPNDIVYADFVHHISHKSHHESSYIAQAVHTVEAHANKTSYTFDTVLPSLDKNRKGEFEQLDVDVYRYYLLPGNKGPLQTRMVVQNVSVILQDLPASNGVAHACDKLLKPKGHPEKGVWNEVAVAAEEAGFGRVDLVAEMQADLW
ncbi:uncharacterized protein MEPE_02548 [Melanopsichium pennsylvanicum]|uniref:FAS1 domain-containing protein n=2 Tax=Melanopsichium pennsylvanicum TaxID=63383 RepID=A0AAJ4XJW5_9BASI|nr:conserved hypothetical protein [Melanopsichium pennsylvanicum 4]SNX83840.1 uncharacterized protein MEPE_02548 [Melanopsichium pennsylvanicum]